MKKNTLYFLPALFLMLSACGGGNVTPRQALKAPVLTVNSEKSGLTWDAVEGAVSYNVTVNQGEAKNVTTPGYTFSSEVGSYAVSVVAVADKAEYNSQAASYSYQTKNTSMSELSAEGAVISWSNVVGMGLEAKVDSGAYAPVTGTSYTATVSGTYTFHVKAGFDEANKINYVESAAGTKTIEIDLRQPLAAPVLRVNNSGNGLTWDAVAGAQQYSIQVNQNDPILVTEPGYAFATEAGQYTVKVKAKADATKYDSEEASFAYEVKATSMSELTKQDKATVSWDSVVGMGVEVKMGSGEFSDVAASPYVAQESGNYTFHVKAGFDEQNKIFYVDSAAGTKQIEIDLRDPLPNPVLRVNEDKDGITWDAIVGADRYTVQIDNGVTQAVEEPGVKFDTTAGQHTIKVKAKADVAKYDSQEVSYSYEVQATAIGALSVNGDDITWASVTGNGVEYNINGGAYAAVSGNKIVATAAGAYNVRAAEGFDEQNKILYVGDATKTALIVKEAAAARILEDGSEESDPDLKAKYEVKKYNNGWVESPTTWDLNRSNLNGEYTEGNAVRISFKRENMDYRFKFKNYAPDKNYNSIGFTIKGNPAADFKIQLKINNDVKLNGNGFKDIYMTYKMKFPSVWTRYVVSFDDANWEIKYGTNTVTPAQVVGMVSSMGFSVDSFADLMPIFDEINFMTRLANDTNWTINRECYIDDFQLALTDSSLSEELPLILNDTYAFVSDATGGRIHKESTGWVLSIPEGDLPVTVNVSGKDATFTCAVPTYDFEVVMTSSDNGQHLTLKSAPTGTVAPLLTNLRAEAYYVLDDFESYANTTALRANYYSDFYGGGNTSVIGGNGWNMCTSSDYLDLASQAANIRNGAHSARMKYVADKDMRFISYGLDYAEAMEYVHGYSTLSFWVKQNSVRENKLKVRVYSVNLVTPSNQADTSYMTEYPATIPQGSEWTEVKVALNTAKVYYGFAITVLKNNGSSSGDGQYFFVDDICLYNELTPWYVEPEEPEETPLQDNYAFTSAAINEGRINKSGNSYTASFVYNTNPMSMPVSVEKVNEGEVEIKSSADDGATFDVVFTADADYKNLTYKSATGTYAALFANAAAEAYYVLDDFESYANTTELQEKYYSDYNGGNSPASVIGGSGWKMCSGTEYLSRNPDKHHTGNASAKLKQHKDYHMRNFSLGLSDGTAKALPKADKLSFWARPIAQGYDGSADIYLKVRVYYVQQVTSSNQGSASACTEQTFTITAPASNAEFVECTINLDQTKTYYGFCILQLSGHTTGFYFLDDICLYNTISPWGNA